MVATLLITGTSHSGKSTLAAGIAQAAALPLIQTDRIARHPGRPWPEPRPHVAEFYAKMSTESLQTFLLHHHQNMWPGLEQKITQTASQGEKCIIEGSALRPEYLCKLPQAYHLSACLYADEATLQARIRSNSAYSTRNPALQNLIDRFIARSLSDQAAQLQAATDHAVPCINSANPAALEAFRQQAIRALLAQPPQSGNPI